MEPTVEIYTDRLKLRPYTVEDIDALYCLLSDPSVRKYLLDDEIVSRKWVTTEIDSNIACFKKHGFGEWSVFLKNKPDLIGFCGFRFFHNPPELQLLYGLAPNYWSQGIATEMVKAMLRYGFEQHGFQQIIGSTDAPNLASVRVMEKAGMNFVKRINKDGSNTVYYAISRERYQPDQSFYSVQRAD